MTSSLEFNRTRKPRPDAVGVFCAIRFRLHAEAARKFEDATGQSQSHPISRCMRLASSNASSSGFWI